MPFTLINHPLANFVELRWEGIQRVFCVLLVLLVSKDQVDPLVKVLGLHHQHDQIHKSVRVVLLQVWMLHIVDHLGLDLK